MTYVDSQRNEVFPVNWPFRVQNFTQKPGLEFSEGAKVEMKSTANHCGIASFDNFFRQTSNSQGTKVLYEFIYIYKEIN